MAIASKVMEVLIVFKWTGLTDKEIEEKITTLVKQTL